MHKKFLYALVTFFLFFSVSSAEDKIYFIDIDQIINQSDIGKKLNKNFDEEFKKENTKILAKEKELQTKEQEILNQKNILSEPELNKKIQDLRKEINDFQLKKRNVTEKLRNKKLEQTNKLVTNLNKILSEYANENSISLIFQKKNIVIGKSSLDITNNIMDIFNKKIKKLVNDKFSQGLYKDINSVYDRENSQREFFTMPSTTIPNNQGDFANWLYMTPKTCKEGNGNQCVANNRERLDGNSYQFI